jgi:Crp-like helix-turn-helix domain
MMPRSLMLGQVAGCNRLHDLAGRLARWLLMIQDRTGNSLLKLTQEFLAEMIGSQRTTVSEVAGGLQDRGLIEYCPRIDKDSRQDRTRKRELRMLSRNQKVTGGRLQTRQSNCI